MESPFDVLGIDRDADEVRIKRAYRERVKEAHPDHGGSAEEFERVREAYEAIKSGESAYEARGESDAIERSRGRPEHAGAGRHRAERSQPPGSRESAAGEDRQEPSRVEYLNYEVLDDHGWSLSDDDLFEKAAEAGLDHHDYGRFLVEPDESLLEAAENRGFAWPFACRGGACANCAVAVTDGEMDIPVNHVLPGEMTDRGVRLSCVGTPTTDETRVVYNLKHLPDLDELRLPPHPFEHAHGSD